MSHYFCHDHPETLTLETEVLEARPGKVVLAQSPFYPGGGGQPADRGVLRWEHGEAAVTGFEYANGKLWHLLAGSAEPSGTVEAVVDPGFRRTMRQLHTDTHILNALIYQAFDGATDEQIKNRFAGMRYGDLKKQVAEMVISRLEPFQQRYREITSDPGYVARVLREGAERVAPIANSTVDLVKSRMGLYTEPH